MTPHDGAFRFHDWSLLHYYHRRYPQLSTDFEALWEEMHAYDQSVWRRQRNNTRDTPSRPDVPVRVSQIITPDEIDSFLFSEWSDAEFPFECQPRCTPEEAALFARAELIAREAPAKQWYYAGSGIVLGPVSLWWLGKLIAAGRFCLEDWLWQDGLENWIPASEVQELGFGTAVPLSSTITPIVIGRLEVTGSDLARAFRPLTKTKGIGRRIVSFEFRDHTLIVGFDEVRVGIPATGVWPGIARVSRAFVRKMATFDLDQLPMVPLAIHDGQMTIADRSHECQWIGT